MKQQEYIHIPYDLYESSYEIVIIMPLWWVKKESIELRIRDYRLHIVWERIYTTLREDCIPIIQECFRWSINTIIDLPPNIAYKNIHSSLSKENILHIIIPKNTVPEEVEVAIEE